MMLMDEKVNFLCTFRDDNDIFSRLVKYLEFLANPYSGFAIYFFEIIACKL